MIDRTKCYCDEAESFVREQLDGVEIGEGLMFDVAAEMTHIPREVHLDSSRMARLVSYQNGWLAVPSTVEYEVLPR